MLTLVAHVLDAWRLWRWRRRRFVCDLPPQAKPLRKLLVRYNGHVFEVEK